MKPTYCVGSQALSCGVTIRQQNGTDIRVHGEEANSTGRKEVRVFEQVNAGEGTGGGRDIILCLVDERENPPGERKH